MTKNQTATVDTLYRFIGTADIAMQAAIDLYRSLGVDGTVSAERVKVATKTIRDMIKARLDADQIEETDTARRMHALSMTLHRARRELGVGGIRKSSVKRAAEPKPQTTGAILDDLTDVQAEAVATFLDIFDARDVKKLRMFADKLAKVWTATK